MIYSNQIKRFTIICLGSLKASTYINLFFHSEMNYKRLLISILYEKIQRRIPAFVLNFHCLEIQIASKRTILSHA